MNRTTFAIEVIESRYPLSRRVRGRPIEPTVARSRPPGEPVRGGAGADHAPTGVVSACDTEAETPASLAACSFRVRMGHGDGLLTRSASIKPNVNQSGGGAVSWGPFFNLNQPAAQCRPAKRGNISRRLGQGIELIHGRC